MKQNKLGTNRRQLLLQNKENMYPKQKTNEQKSFGEFLLNHNENLQIENYNTQVVKFILHQIIIDFCTGNEKPLRL